RTGRGVQDHRSSCCMAPATSPACGCGSSRTCTMCDAWHREGAAGHCLIQKEAAVRALLGFASIAVVCVCQAPATLLAQERPPIIDMHLHADLPPHEIAPGMPA